MTKASNAANLRLLYRCLGVPDMIGEGNMNKAAARRLAEAAGLDVTADPNVDSRSRVRLADAAVVFAQTRELIALGELDGFIGAFGYKGDDWYASRLISHADLDSYEVGYECAQALLIRLRAYTESHPFEDDVGRPFT